MNTMTSEQLHEHMIPTVLYYCGQVNSDSNRYFTEDQMIESGWESLLEAYCFSIAVLHAMRDKSLQRKRNKEKKFSKKKKKNGTVLLELQNNSSQVHTVLTSRKNIQRVVPF